MTRAYLRYPHVRGDLITFTAAADVWLAPVTGGRAWRLSDDATPVTSPRFSPDGSHVAWVTTRDGHAEVVVAPSAGGDSERLTWFGRPRCALLGWRDDGHVLVASDVGQGHRYRRLVHSVGLDGSVERLDYGLASGLAIHPGGAVALTTPGSLTPAWWKRYRGGTAPRLWIDARGDGTWRRLARDVAAPLVDPMWIGDTLVVTSDLGASFPDRADEQANLWAIDRRGRGGHRQITHHTAAEGYVRDASTDGERIVYHSRGSLYLLSGLDAAPERIDVTLGATVASRRPRSLNPTENLEGVHPDHGGDASVLEWRGKAFWLAHREGPARALVADSSVRAREPLFLGRTGKVLVVTDRDGDDRIEIHDVTGGEETRSLAPRRLGRVLHVESNPAGDTVATISHDGTIRVGSVESGRMREIHRSEHGEALSPAFSPDGRYLAWSEPVGVGEFHRLVGVDLRARRLRAVALTSGKFDDRSPSFSRDGKYLLFLSARTFDPAYDQQSFGLSFVASMRPSLLPLSATEAAPFGPSADGWRISAPPAAAAKPATADAGGPGGPGGPADDAGADDAAPKPETVPESPPWDVEGIEDRIVAFPVPSANYRDLVAVKDGAAWMHLAAEQGVLGTRRAGTTEEPADAIECFSFTKRKLEVIAEKADGFAVSGDGERIVVRDGTALTVRPADRAVKPDDPDCVTVDLGRLRFQLDPVGEWRQMFEESARLMAQNYWRADMNGIDWPAVVARYRPLLDTIACRDDLDDVLWEVAGELNSSHAYVIPPGTPGDTKRCIGQLGADLSSTADGWRIDRIVPGESSDPAARSPLRAAGVGAQEGDVIVAVGGVPVDPRTGPAAALVGAADQPIELTLRTGSTGSAGGSERRVVVVPLADESPLRYHDWVRSRIAYVTERSGGRVGYLHVPDMQAGGWAQLHRDIHLAMRREGVVVDVRYNSGGHTSQLVIERLVRRVVGWDITRDAAESFTYPSDAPRGPVVLVTNEDAGSDGDIVNAAAQALGIAPVVGVRTWGGVIGIDGRYGLVDGTLVTQPKYSSWFEGKGWDVENHGVDPDIEVEIAPWEHLHDDNDRQLDRAVDEVLKRLKRTPAVTPPPMPPPRVRS